MKVGVLGGSFDPPHIGHLYVAKTLLKNKYCEKVIFMPAFRHPFGKQSLDPSHRLAMTKLLETKNIEVFDSEIKREKISYTIDTLNSLKNQSPKDNFVWIIGEDQIKDFEKWKDWKEIIEKFGLIVMPRQKRSPRRSPSATFEVQYAKTFKSLNISSSEIRERTKKGLPIDNLVPKEVKNYIIKHKLYR
jgi:nicotinate-nucleotide adenylyltransferase